METRLLAYEHAVTVSEIAAWANNLIGKEVPGDPGFTVVRVIQFQTISNQGNQGNQGGQNGYDAMILVEVTEKHSDTQVALKEADIEVIEELTSSIDETTQN
ncbi:MAG: hypothetical protein E6J48_14980 [Chloroflexi bacterium]|jgi:hypothetical protein|nr:MAG: hypothetical protein E6J48_14980 [Chloroflexota bacterium]